MEATRARILDIAGTPAKMTTPGDVEATVAAIVDIYESLGDLVMQWLADEKRKPQLKKTLDEGRADHREWVGRVFAPQLALVRTRPERARLASKSPGGQVAGMLRTHRAQDQTVAAFP